MILKTKDVDEYKLKKQAKAIIRDYVKPEDTVCYIPYLDVAIARIKYIKFVLIQDRWVTVD